MRSSEQHSSSSSSTGLESLRPSWRLSWVSLVLFLLFATIVVGAALPPRLLDPTWQLGLLSAMVNTAAFPLVGLGLLHLAADLDPSNERIGSYRRLCARLAVPVVLGFVLILPVQAFALWQQSLVDGAREAQLARAENNLSSLRQAVEGASTVADLQKRLTSINQPPLSAAELIEPLPMLKMQARAALQQAQHVLIRERERSPKGGLLVLLPNSLRNAVACLALALGFAALAQRRYGQVPLLQEWLHGMQQMRIQAYRRRFNPPNKKNRWPFR